MKGPSTSASPEPQMAPGTAAAASHDEDWAAFMDASAAPVAAASQAALATANEHWDAFQVQPTRPLSYSPCGSACFPCRVSLLERCLPDLIFSHSTWYMPAVSVDVRKPMLAIGSLDITLRQVLTSVIAFECLRGVGQRRLPRAQLRQIYL